ncbi:MAG: dockerin type I domain-containing protein [Ruminococcus sp.]|nr:dockerin type I domain-containing protein [Ruminococcus sp.]
MAKSRLIGDYPVIGIRPTIDGRRGALGVRQSLEEQTMNMATSVKKLFEENLKYSNGEPVKVIVSDTTIGRVAEAVACENQFKKAGVDITLTVTPCWCYGSETMDMNPMTIKGVWGFNGTERPGAVYLASVLATHTQKGLPAFGIYGHDVQDADCTDIPEDVKEKLLRFGRCAVACATMRGKSYLQIGSICMGIGGSIIDSAFIEEYLGMRVESVDEVEIIRRMEQGIYDEKEYQKALAWTKEKCIEGFDKNPLELQKTPEQKEKDWEFVVKMMCIIKDLMNGNQNLPEGREEEMVGHNAIAGGFQGQRQWTDFYPNCDFAEALLNTSFDWNGAREPYILATENDVLNGLGMLFMKLLTNKAQMFADVRTYWSADAVKKATGYDIEGVAKQSDGFIHLINSGACCLDANAKAIDQDGKPCMKEWYNITQDDQDAIMNATTWSYADCGYFRGGEGDIFSFGDDENGMKLHINEDGSLLYSSTTNNNSITGTSSYEFNLETGKWYTIKLSIVDDVYENTPVRKVELVVDDGESEYVSELIKLDMDTLESIEDVSIVPRNVARCTDSNSFIFGKFNGSADYFRVSYKESANDNSYYYTETEDIIDVPTPIPTNNVGDINLDGSVDYVDILSLKKYLLGIASVESYDYDINSDENVNILDLTTLKNIVIYIND